MLVNNWQDAHEKAPDHRAGGIFSYGRSGAPAGEYPRGGVAESAGNPGGRRPYGMAIQSTCRFWPHAAPALSTRYTFTLKLVAEISRVVAEKVSV